MLYHIVDTIRLAIWAGFMALLVISQLAIRIPQISKKLTFTRHANLFFAISILQSLAWGFTIVYFSASVTPEHEVFMTLLVCGVAAAALPLLSHILPLYITYSILLIGPAITFQSLYGEQSSYMIALSCAIYLVAINMVSLAINRNSKKLNMTKEDLDNRESLIKSIYNSPTDISIITCDIKRSDYKVLSFSSGAETIFGHRKADAIGKPLRSIFNEEAYESCLGMLEKVKSGESARRQIDFVANIGIVHNLAVSMYPIQSKGSNIHSALITSIDISQSKHAEEALINTEEKFHNIIDASPMGIHMYQLDRKGRLIFTGANPAADNITGFDNQKLIGLPIEQAFPDFSKTEIPGAFKKVATEGIPLHLNQFEYADNQLKAVFDVSAFQTSPGKMVSMFFDIIDRVNTEKALRRTEKRFRDIALSGSDWIWECDAAGNFTYVSEGVRNITGYEPEELLGKFIFGLVSNEQPEKLRESFVQASSQKESINDLTSWQTHKEGASICIVTNGIPITDNNGRLLGYRGNNRDITEQKRNEERLAQSEERYRTLIESMEEGLLIVSPDDTVILLNRPACDIFGLSPERIIGSDLDKITIDSSLSVTYNDALKNRNRGRGKYEVILQRHDGQKRHVQISVSMLRNQQGDILGSYGVLTDITDIKKVELEKVELREQLTNAQRMESLGVLAGGVAHDLNNILGPLVAYPDLIKMKIDDDSPLVNDIMKIKKSAERASDVVQDLLILARRGRYEFHAVDLGNLVESYLRSPEFGTIKSKYPDIVIIPRLNPETPPVSGSETHLAKIIANLINNGMDAMPESGELTITLDHGHVDKLIGGFANIEAGDYIILTVRDTGSGIDKNDIKHIFEPFYSKRKMGRSGSGLGLSITYGIVKDHNGYIDVKSETGKGSDFVVYFPMVDLESQSRANVVVDIRGSETVLIVDDIEEQRELAATILSSLGYNTKTAASSADAIEFLKNNHVDLVILDMIMDDDIDGLDTYRQIIGIKPDMKAIIASGFSETDRVKEAEKLGVAKYIRKPYNMQILGKAIREILAPPQTVKV